MLRNHHGSIFDWSLKCLNNVWYIRYKKILKGCSAGGNCKYHKIRALPETSVKFGMVVDMALKFHKSHGTKKKSHWNMPFPWNPKWPPEPTLWIITFLLEVTQSYVIPLFECYMGQGIWIDDCKYSLAQNFVINDENPRWPPITVVNSNFITIGHRILCNTSKWGFCGSRNSFRTLLFLFKVKIYN